jgi:hypothetical protein
MECRGTTSPYTICPTKMQTWDVVLNPIHSNFQKLLHWNQSLTNQHNFSHSGTALGHWKQHTQDCRSTYCMCIWHKELWMAFSSYAKKPKFLSFSIELRNCIMRWDTLHWQRNGCITWNCSLLPHYKIPDVRNSFKFCLCINTRGNV